MRKACLFMGEPYFSGFEPMLRKVSEEFSLVVVDFATKVHWKYREHFDEVLQLKEFSSAALEEMLREFEKKYELGCCLCFSEYHVALREKALTRFAANPNGEHLFEVVRNKAAMRGALKGSNVLQPQFIAANDVDGAVAAGRSIGYPVVVKPLLGYAGMGVVKAKSEPEIRQAYLECSKTIRIKQSHSYAFHGVAPGTVLVEQYVAGNEFAVDAIVHDGKVHSYFTAEKGQTEKDGYFPENLLITPADARAGDALEKATTTLVEAFGIRCGVLHAEFRVTADEHAVFLEVGFRPGLRRAVVMAYNVDLAFEDYLVRTGREPTFKSRSAAAQHVCNVLLYPERFGKYDGIDRGKLPAGAEFTELMPLGTPVAPLPYNDGFIGNVWLAQKTRDELLAQVGTLDTTGLVKYA